MKVMSIYVFGICVSLNYTDNKVELKLSAVMVMVAKGEEKGCSLVLDNKNCNLPKCVQDCYQQYNGKGACGPSFVSPSGRSCVCVIKCN